MQTINLSVKVETNASVTPEQVAKLLQRLVDAGLSDAIDTAGSGEGDVQFAELASDLNIHAPEVAAVPRVLVVVSGGIADPVWEGDVEVEVFDHDNYKDDPSIGGVSAAFACLATQNGIPVQSDDDVDEDDDIDPERYSDGGLYSALGAVS